MRQPPQSVRASSDEKLSAILDQLGRLRLRLNALALQRAIFTSLALLIGGGAALVLTALAFAPLTFLAAAILLAAALIIALVRSVTQAWRSRVDAEGTASLADRRVDFKDRLTTLVALAGRDRSSLWPYLLEETLTLQHEFDLSRVERHRVSRSLYALLLSGALAGLAAILVIAPAKLGLAAKVSPPREVNVPVGNLQVRPSDPALDPEAEVSGDPAAMQELADREQEAGGEAASGDSTGTSKLMDKARDLAAALQNKLTGRKPAQRPKMKLRLTGEPKDQSKSSSARNHSTPQSEPESMAGNESGRGEEQTPNSNGGASEPGPESPQGQQAQPRPGDMASNKPIVEPARPDPGAANNFSNGPSESSPGRNAPGGASHGSGTDPEHLFGRADKPPAAKDGFSITLEARLSEHGPAAGGRGYVPPKVQSTLNSDQQPDEPLSRGAVPADDRQTVKRVFER